MALALIRPLRILRPQLWTGWVATPLNAADDSFMTEPSGLMMVNVADARDAATTLAEADAVNLTVCRAL